ncbi:Guanine nucleotide-binding-like protein 1 [Gamsiella multidivaricata]|nr:Guanine nucleotide-binding-like protein 1 [Gamsiella multidivaricata]
MPRAKPFSGALKKKQLQERRARHSAKLQEQQQQTERTRDPVQHEIGSNNTSGIEPYSGRFVKSFSKEYKPESSGGARISVRENSNHPAGTRLRSVFMRRSQADIEISRRASMQPLELLPESALEVSFEAMFPEVIGFPKRPKWDYSMSREELEKNETRMFEAWMDSIYNRYPADELSYFEHNLEVWRQLWRVLEISDIIMIIVDIRHPVIHFPPSLYQYVVNDMKRKLVVVFNKVDLVAPNTLFAWKQYFKEEFPELHIASFSCYPPDPTLINDSSTAALQRVVKRPRRRFYNAVGVKDVLVACKDVELSKNGDQVDWDGLIAQHDAEKEAEFQESEGESDQEHGREQDQDESQKNLLEKDSDQRLANAILRLANDGRILLSFKPPGYFTSSKYEKLRIAAADELGISEDDQENGNKQHAAVRMKNARENEDQSDEDGLDSDAQGSGEESAGGEGTPDLKKGSKFQMKTRVGGFFGLLQEDEDEEDEDEEDEDEDGDDGDDDEEDEEDEDEAQEEEADKKK